MGMEDPEFLLEDDIIGQIDWDSVFDELPEDANVLPMEPLIVTEGEAASSNSSPGSASSWIDEIETMLMKDDDDKVTEEPSKEFCDSLLADVLVDSPREGSGEVVDASSASDDENCNSDKGKVDTPEVNEDVHGEDDEDGGDDDAADDPISKKRRRQLRNRDSAVRSRERKKMHVRDLEIKSKYLEGECRRLGHLLQFYYAENQALRLSLHSGNASGASMAKQESAVLLLESLLLGSLLWFLGIMCLFTLPTTLERVLVENAGKKSPGVALRGARRKMFEYVMVQSFVKSRRCKASRTKMRPSYLVL